MRASAVISTVTSQHEGRRFVIVLVSVNVFISMWPCVFNLSMVPPAFTL